MGVRHGLVSPGQAVGVWAPTMSLLNLDQCRGRYNREVNACLVLVGRQNTVLRHSSSKQSLLKTRQQVLCDLVLHQHLFTALLKGKPQYPDADQSPQPQLPATNLLAAHAALHACGSACECAFCSAARHQLLMTSVGAGAVPEQLQGAGPAASGPQRKITGLPDRLVPGSYVSRLLLSATQQQLQEAKSMTAQDFAAFVASLMPHLLLLLEMSARHECRMATFEDGCGSSSSSSNRPFSTPAKPTSPLDPHSPTDTPAAAAPSSNSPAAAATAGADSDSPPSPQHLPGGIGGASPAPATFVGPAGFSGWLPGLQFPLGSCPVMDLNQLLEAVDRGVTVLLLALLHNHLPLLQASAWASTAGQACGPSTLRWQHVVQRLRLTEEQEVQLAVCMQEYQRQARRSRQKGVALPTDVATPSPLLTLQEAEQARTRAQGGAAAAPPGCAADATTGTTTARPGNTPKAAAGGDNDGEAAAAAAAAAATAGCLSQQEGTEVCSLLELELQLRLLKYSPLQHRQLACLVSLVINTLSQTQLATALVAAHPFVPDFLAIAAAACGNLQRRRKQQGLPPLEEALLPGAIPAGGRSSGAAAAAERAAAAAPAAASSDSDACAQSGGVHKELRPSAEPVQLLQSITGIHVQQRAAALQAHDVRCLAELKQLHPPAPAQQQQQQQQAPQQRAWAGSAPAGAGAAGPSCSR